MKQATNWDDFGFTTGLAAAAAAAAACELIANDKHLCEVRIETPDRERELVIEIADSRKRGFGAAASVIKRAGPDRDITNGALIEVEVTPTSTGSARVEGGIGVGQVTRPGLAAPMGTTAINPVPLAHIKKVVMARLPGGANVTIVVPDGADLAKKTFNSRLGIVGGISILGTRGIVRPMSLTSWKAALLPQLNQAAALGLKTVALAPGNLGAAAAAALGLPQGAIAQMGNFAGFMIREAAKRRLNIVIIGHLGKVVKIACGYENTHYQRTPDRLLLVAKLVKKSRPDLAAAVAAAGSAEAATRLLVDQAPACLSLIAKAAFCFLKKLAPQNSAGVMITDLHGRVVAGYPEKAGLAAVLL